MPPTSGDGGGSAEPSTEARARESLPVIERGASRASSPSKRSDSTDSVRRPFLLLPFAPFFFFFVFCVDIWVGYPQLVSSASSPHPRASVAALSRASSRSSLDAVFFFFSLFFCCLGLSGSGCSGVSGCGCVNPFSALTPHFLMIGSCRDCPSARRNVRSRTQSAELVSSLLALPTTHTLTQSLALPSTHALTNPTYLFPSLSTPPASTHARTHARWPPLAFASVPLTRTRTVQGID